MVVATFLQLSGPATRPMLNEAIAGLTRGPGFKPSRKCLAGATRGEGRRRIGGVKVGGMALLRAMLAHYRMLRLLRLGRWQSAKTTIRTFWNLYVSGR
jgi:hypothetical protein